MPDYAYFPFGVGPHDDIMLPFGGGCEDFGEGRPQLVEGASGAERNLAAGVTGTSP
jgi:hypothetical protein